MHAKAKAEACYRFYALYDKISREDILAHAYARCRSNKGAPGVDRQDFEAVEAYGVERWLGELALALRQETAPSARRIGRSTLTQPCGCAGGCAPSTNSGDEGAGAIHSRTSTGTLGSYV